MNKIIAYDYNSVDFPDGEETLLASFSNEMFKVDSVSEDFVNGLKIYIEVHPFVPNIDLKTKEPFIKISDGFGKIYAEESMVQPGTTFREPLLYAYEVNFGPGYINGIYKKQFPVRNKATIKSYMDSLPKLSFVVFSYIDNNEHSLEAVDILNDLFGSKLIFANRGFNIRHIWTGVWGSLDPEEPKYLMYENRKNVSAFYDPTKETSSISLSIVGRSLSKEEFEPGFITSLNEIGFKTNSLDHENRYPGFICSFDSEGNLKYNDLSES